MKRSVPLDGLRGKDLTGGSPTYGRRLLSGLGPIESDSHDHQRTEGLGTDGTPRTASCVICDEEEASGYISLHGHGC